MVPIPTLDVVEIFPALIYQPLVDIANIPVNPAALPKNVPALTSPEEVNVIPEPIFTSL